MRVLEAPGFADAAIVELEEIDLGHSLESSSGCSSALRYVDLAGLPVIRIALARLVAVQVDDRWHWKELAGVEACGRADAVSSRGEVEDDPGLRGP